ncbi:hypothetical protein HK103_004643 [Boothiomyces macroporosus]|uniref:F-box domain-containing protein n=1 Tax=Boothiomyces macroporosus TaxID=261099 RepID=A0AAD5YAZ3_9FUNG|nr:hypothetical protein HK103_004643 [Boothiomyces macroporosus]
MTETTIKVLPREILISIFSYLDMKELLNCSEACQLWNNVANDNSFYKKFWYIWSHNSNRRWKGKWRMALELHPRCNYSRIIDTLSVKEIKSVLKKRLIPIKGLLEKSELKKALLDSDPKDQIAYFPKWKASFVAAEKDSKRTAITKEELCTTEW